MKPRTFVARTALIALFASLVYGCASTPTAEDRAYQRATGQRVMVSGSRIPRRVDPQSGNPTTEYPLESYESDRARAEFEAMREAQMRSRRR